MMEVGTSARKAAQPGAFGVGRPKEVCALAAPRDRSGSLDVVPPLQLHNGLWLIVPLLLFNLAFASRLPAWLSANVVPRRLGWLEHGLRVVVFVAPILFPLGLQAPHQRYGLALFGVGSLVYFASWVPILTIPDSAWSRGLVGGLAPAYTPAALLTGIAWMGDSPAYGVSAALFVVVHTAVTYAKLRSEPPT